MAEYNAPVYIEDLGDGLFRLGYDIICAYPIISYTASETSAVYEFEPYTVTVSWDFDETANKKSNIRWVREYPDETEE